MKVYELASDLEVESSAVLAVCIALELEITSHMQNLTDEQAEAVTDRLANPVEEETGDETPDTVAEEGDTDLEEDEEATPPLPPPPPPAPKLSLEDIKVLSVDVNEMSDVGFEALYDNLPALVVELYPNKDQFALALKSKREGNHDLGRQALRNGLVDLK